MLINELYLKININGTDRKRTDSRSSLKTINLLQDSQRVDRSQHQAFRRHKTLEQAGLLKHRPQPGRCQVDLRQRLD